MARIAGVDLPENKKSFRFLEDNYVAIEIVFSIALRYFKRVT